MSGELQCAQCDFKPKGKSGSAKQSLKRHVKYVHDKVRDQRCPECAFAATDYRILKKHLEKEHGIVKDKPAKMSTRNMIYKGHREMSLSAALNFFSKKTSFGS